ncbi:hypothetical protein [Streptomyces sp. MNP-20]|uniref:hypothetical protein n=1 Tax=Streptomyces sp. MNP-20 TaxID=2721165 RepID=UPI0015544B69|nr:hypothetical protein [Streptomyces sp. MNP-20]
MTEPRHTASTVTDDALAALYDERDALLAALARVYAWADELDQTAQRVHPDAVHPVAAGLRHRIDYGPRKESTTS